MIRTGNTIAIVRCAAILLAGHSMAVYAGETNTRTSIGYEFIGQVLNASATQSLQYGYLNLVPDLSPYQRRIVRFRKPMQC
jgi:hypothetical protein